jgi:hypothetical protein
MGQTEKNSVRANVFRFTPKLGHRSIHLACLKRAKGGSGQPESRVGVAANRSFGGTLKFSWHTRYFSSSKRVLWIAARHCCNEYEQMSANEERLNYNKVNRIKSADR